MFGRENIFSLLLKVCIEVGLCYIIRHESVGLENYNFISIYPCYYRARKGLLPAATQEFIRIAEKSSNSSILKVTFNIKSSSEVRLF